MAKQDRRGKSIIKIIFINLIVFFCIFIFLELVFRAIYPEFTNQTHSPEMTSGWHKTYSDKLDGFEGTRVRIPYQGYKLENNSKIVLILGDSISDGYGSPYEDIYYAQFQRLVNTTNVDSIQAISLSGYGNNLSDAKTLLENLASNDSSHNIHFILYQFNYNDVTPYGSKQLKDLRGILGTGLFKTIAEWRYQYMNRSVFLRVVQHYAGVISRNRFGSCEERGFDALGSYTWTFGSKAFKTQSEDLWIKLQNDIAEIKNISDSMGARFVILITPFLYDIDKTGYHHYYNSYGLDFTCSTIEPKTRLNSIADLLDIDVVDPARYVKERFDERIKEGNFTPFYFPADDNHFLPVTADYIAEYLYNYYKDSLAVSSPETVSAGVQ